MACSSLKAPLAKSCDAAAAAGASAVGARVHEGPASPAVEEEGKEEEEETPICDLLRLSPPVLLPPVPLAVVCNPATCIAHGGLGSKKALPAPVAESCRCVPEDDHIPRLTSSLAKGNKQPTLEFGRLPLFQQILAELPRAACRHRDAALLSASGAVAAVEYAVLVGRWCSETRSTVYLMERVSDAGGLESGRRRVRLPPLLLSRRRPAAIFLAEASPCITIAVCGDGVPYHRARLV